ncbi:hypothetical protein RRG08_002761 [Elysia crispata]|uniref:Uncharacterized protein n=1 Tax=Elysia crispata TaxID=231223 RepID=A0AAE0XUY0_9GAST|nr:hypothetical protein RRG08_002761 [Elysia crispata]
MVEVFDMYTPCVEIYVISAMSASSSCLTDSRDSHVTVWFSEVEPPSVTDAKTRARTARRYRPTANPGESWGEGGGVGHAGVLKVEKGNRLLKKFESARGQMMKSSELNWEGGNSWSSVGIYPELSQSGCF